MRRVAFVVIGEAQPSGSKTARPMGRRWGVVESNKEKLRPWQDRVEDAAAEAMAADDVALFDGPVRLDVTFYRPRPKGHYLTGGGINAHGSRHPFPDTKPDRTKLLRGLEDALKGVVWRDDAQVCAGEAWKRWGEPARAEVVVQTLEEG